MGNKMLLLVFVFAGLLVCTTSARKLTESGGDTEIGKPAGSVSGSNPFAGPHRIEFKGMVHFGPGGMDLSGGGKIFMGVVREESMP